jgi:hypothetical protein
LHSKGGAFRAAFVLRAAPQIKSVAARRIAGVSTRHGTAKYTPADVPARLGTANNAPAAAENGQIRAGGVFSTVLCFAVLLCLKRKETAPFGAVSLSHTGMK